MQEHRHICPVCRHEWRHIKPDCEERFGSKCPACRAYDREPQLQPLVPVSEPKPPQTFIEFVNEWLDANLAVMAGKKVGRA